MRKHNFSKDNFRKTSLFSLAKCKREMHLLVQIVVEFNWLQPSYIDDSPSTVAPGFI